MTAPASFPISPFLAMPIALACLLALILGLRLYQRAFAPHPEGIRKLLHVGMGLVVLPFPWVFRDHWPVLLLSGLAILLLVAMRLVPFLKQGIGSVVSGVHRSSWGDVYFALSIAILFCLHERPLLFVIPILLLTLADAVAALIGIRYGRLHYEAAEGEKTAEGSVAFFTVAFFSVHVPLLLCTDVGRPQTLLISLMAGLLIMLMEAIAWRGLDNLFIPIGAYAILIRYLPLSVDQLLTRLLVTLLLVVLVFAFRRRSTLTDAGLMGAALFGYASYALGGVVWLFPPLLLFLCHTNLWPRSSPAVNRHNIQALFAVGLPGLFWLFLRARTGQPIMFLPFTTVMSVHLSVMGASWLPSNQWSFPKILKLSLCILAGAALAAASLGIAYGLLRLGVLHVAWPPSEHLVRFLLHTLAVVGGAAVVFALLLPALIDPETRQYRHIHALGGTLAFLASLLVYWQL